MKIPVRVYRPYDLTPLVIDNLDDLLLVFPFAFSTPSASARPKSSSIHSAITEASASGPGRSESSIAVWVTRLGFVEQSS